MNELELLEKGRREKQEYINENYHGTKDNAVEGEESDPYLQELNEKIDNMEDYLREKYEELI